MPRPTLNPFDMNLFYQLLHRNNLNVSFIQPCFIFYSSEDSLV